MKKRNLPFSLLLIFIVLCGLVFSSFIIDDGHKNQARNQLFGQEIPSIEQSANYLAALRSNQISGVISPGDLKRLNSELQSFGNNRGSGDSEWSQIGPDNFGGRTRTILFDNTDQTANTLFAGAVSGGIWKSTNLGITWVKVNQSTSCLNVVTMVQTPNGDIYAGTGEGFNAQDYSNLDDMGYSSGFMGQGIFKSTDGENFSLLSTATPDFNDMESDWAFVNKLAADKNSGRVYAATNTGVKYSDDGGQNWNTAVDTAGNMLNLNSTDVEVASDGMVITVVNNLCYLSTSGNANQFILRSTGDSISLPATGVGRIEFAIAPSDPNVVYASVINTIGSTLNIYRSDDQGLTWRIILPGTPTINIYGGAGVYANTLTVFPTDPDRILVGGVNLWQGTKLQATGYFEWQEISQYFSNPYDPTYLHYYQHAYVFRPGYPTNFYCGTDGGVYKGVYSQGAYTFSSLNRGYVTTQFYSGALSGIEGYVMGGSQSNGTIIITGEGNTPQEGAGVLGGIGVGGSCAISLIKPGVIVVTTNAGNILRSDDYGDNYSSPDQFPGGGITNPQAFITPIALWENFNNENSRDSVMYYARENIPGGTKIQVRSNNSGQPFYYTTPADVDLNNGDSILVKDIVSSRLFVAVANSVYMTSDLHQFDQTPTWYAIANSTTGFTGTPNAIAYSADANQVFVGTLSGKLYRISNLALAYNFDRADVSSPSCIVAIQQMQLLVPGTEDPVTQAITSIAIDPTNSNNVAVTLGNYGNDNYIFYSENALDQFPTFSTKQGNLPHMPIYSSLVEMTNTNLVVLGTEHGIFMTENIKDSSPTWTKFQDGMQSVPVFQLSQQIVSQPHMTVKLVNGNEITYIEYPGTNNFGDIYAATYGRGIFMNNYFNRVGIDENVFEETSSLVNSLKFYPNPVNSGTQATIEVEVNKNCQGTLRLYDLSGKMLIDQKTHFQSGNNSLKIGFENFGTGTYLLQTIIGKETYSNKIVIN